MQADTYERTKTLKTYKTGTRVYSDASVWCKQSLSQKKFSKNLKNLEADNISCDFIWLFKNKFVPLWRVFHGYIKLFSAVVVVKRWRFFFMRVCMRVRAKNAGRGMFLCRYNGIEYRNIRFEPLFKPIERISTLYPNSYPPRRF